MSQVPGYFNASIQGTTALVKYLLGKQSDLTVSSLHGNKYRAAYGGSGVSLYSGANQSGVTTSAGLATTYAGLCLSNPAASGFNLSVRRVRGAFIVAPATVTGINLIIGYAAGGITAHTTPVTPTPGLINGSTVPVGKLDAACTLVGTPTYYGPLAETASATSLLAFSEDVEGAILIPPGGYMAIGTTIAGPAAGFMGGIEWTEAVQ